MLATKHARRTSEDALAARIASELDKIEESLCDMPRVTAAAFFGKHLDELELDLKKRILAGALRRFDFQVAEEVAARVAASPGAPVRILELAAGRSIPERVNFHYGAPYLSRAMKCVFGESADITVSDLYAENLDKKLERELFGLSVIAGVDYGKLDQLEVERPFDFIFLRHGLPGQRALIPPHLLSAEGGYFCSFDGRGRFPDVGGVLFSGGASPDLARHKPRIDRVLEEVVLSSVKWSKDDIRNGFGVRNGKPA